MKKLFITVFCLSLVYTSVNAQNSTTTGQPTTAQPATAAPAPQAAPQQVKPAPNPRGPKFKFKAGDSFDFGTITEGPIAEHEFEFKNVGKEPLIIQNASASCGCTIPSWPKEPILPGKKGVILVKYNTQGRVAPFHKDIFIQSNAVNPPEGRDKYELHISGTVKAADKPATPPAGTPAKS